MVLSLFIITRLFLVVLITTNTLGIIGSVPYMANKYSIHAEQSCINKCKNKKIIKYCTLILVTIKNDTLNKCCPCSMCEHIIKKYKVRKVINYYNC